MHSVNRYDRNQLNHHNSFLIWMTGLSGSGKSTIANVLLKRLHKEGIRSYLLDGDNLRYGINSDLSFTPEDRHENIRRTAEIGKLMVDAGLIVIAALITPLEKDRNIVKEIIGKENCKIVFIDCSLEECERRDPKGLYKKARKGEIQHFTGISQKFEPPASYDYVIDTSKHSIDQCVEQLWNFITPLLR